MFALELHGLRPLLNKNPRRLAGIFKLFKVFYIIATRSFIEDGLSLCQCERVERGDAVASERAIVFITNIPAGSEQSF
jgi:hypothetical protein